MKVAASDIDRLISGIEVNFVSLTECVVSPGGDYHFPLINPQACTTISQGTED